MRSSPNRWTAFTEIIEDGSISLDFDMQVGGILEGHVQNGAGTTTARSTGGAVASVGRDDGAPLDRAGGRHDRRPCGEYLIDSLPGGTYNMRVGGASNYIPEFWKDHLSRPPRRPTAVRSRTGGATCPSSRNSSSARSHRSGQEHLDAGAARVVATAYIDNGTDFLPFARDDRVGPAPTRITGLPVGGYRVGFASAESAEVKYIDRYWSTVGDTGDATSFTLATAATKTTINVVMTKGASVSGVITLEGGGVPASSDIHDPMCRQYDDRAAHRLHRALRHCGVRPGDWRLLGELCSGGSFQLCGRVRGHRQLPFRGVRQRAYHIGAMPLVVRPGRA